MTTEYDHIQHLDIAENGDVVATWVSGGEHKVFSVPAENMIFFLNMQSEPKRAPWSAEKRRKQMEYHRKQGHKVKGGGDE